MKNLTKKAIYIALTLGLFSSMSMAYQDGDNIDERIAPVAGYVGTFTNPNTIKAPLSGKEVFESTCATCHQTGVSGAPRIGNEQEWSSRIAQGVETVYEHALHGLNAMPAKGGNPALSDYEVELAVHYMVNASGRSFPEPKKP